MLKLYLVSKYMGSTNSYFHFGSVSPCYPFVFRRPYIVRVFQGFAFLLHVISSSFFTREYWNRTLCSATILDSVRITTWYLQFTHSFHFMCSIVSFYGIIHNWTFENLVLHFLPPPLDSRRSCYSPLRSSLFFLRREKSHFTICSQLAVLWASNYRQPFHA